MEQYLGNLRDGVRDGRTAPTIAAERVIAQLRALLATRPDDSPMAAPAASQPPELADALRRAVAEVVYPAFQRMLDFLEGYLTRDARQDPGVWAVTDGQEIYALLARQHTTTELTPDELHQIGLDDLASIHQEMRAIMARRGAGRHRHPRLHRDAHARPEQRGLQPRRADSDLRTAAGEGPGRPAPRLRPAAANPDRGQGRRGVSRARRARGVLLPGLRRRLAARRRSTSTRSSPSRVPSTPCRRSRFTRACPGITCRSRSLRRPRTCPRSDA